MCLSLSVCVHNCTVKSCFSLTPLFFVFVSLPLNIKPPNGFRSLSHFSLSHPLLSPPEELTPIPADFVDFPASFPVSGHLIHSLLRSDSNSPEKTHSQKERRRSMGHFSSMFNGLAKSFSMRKGRSSGNSGGREAADAMAKNAKKNDLILRSSGTMNVESSNNFASVFSRRGEKGVNQDCFIVWEEFGCQEDMMFCGMFDGHGPWGHFVAKKVRDSMPSSLLCNWQETLAESSLDADFDLDSGKKLHKFNMWKHSYLKTCAAVDQELVQHRGIDSFHSGTTALSIVRQGDLIVVANVGDSRAVLASTSDSGSLVAIPLTVDFKPNLPHETERIVQCKGRVFCLSDEPGVHRLWLPDEECPGLAMSRAFGDFCVKGFGLISVPEVTQRHITSRDQFAILATDGVWDVVSNQEAVEIVSSTPDKAKSAKRLVEYAVRAWKRKRRGFAKDDISAICLFFHTSVSQQVYPVISPQVVK